MQVMADEFWRQFYGKNFKGGQSTLYLGDRFWNVKMDGLTDSCVFTHGCSEMVNDLALDRRSIFVFSMVGNKIFELSVFNHQTSTQIQNNKVELVVLDDSIYGDDLVIAVRIIHLYYYLVINASLQVDLEFHTLLFFFFFCSPNIRRSVVLPKLTFRKVLLWNVKTTNFSWQVLSLCSM